MLAQAARESQLPIQKVETTANQQLRIEHLEGKGADDEWAQLRLMEKFLEQQRLELLRQGAPDSDDEDWDGPQGPDEMVVWKTRT
jgi:hypothetical protein